MLIVFSFDLFEGTCKELVQLEPSLHVA